jgi:acyl-coenzyme A synthetase/AMP-(fatty) acid ligase
MGKAPSNEIIWRPTEEYMSESNVRRFMDRHGISDYRELQRRSVLDIEWFWEAALKDLGGDWARIDEDGFWFIEGRADDTIKVAGRRTGPAEIEAALIGHAMVSEAAAIGVPDDVKGEVIVCFAVTKPGGIPGENLAAELTDQVAQALGRTLRPARIHFVSSLPKTRSAKIVRGAIKRRYLGLPQDDISSVENPEALDGIPKMADTEQ